MSASDAEQFPRELAEFMTVYLHAVLVYSRTRGEHLKHRRIVRTNATGTDLPSTQ